MSRQTESHNRTRDARGRSVTMLDPVSLHVLHRHEVIEPDALERIVEDLEPGTARIRRWMIVIVPVCVAAVVLGIAALYCVSDPSARKDLVSTLMNPAISLPGVIGGVVAPWIAARQARFKKLRGVMLLHRRCPHCGYNLFGLQPAPEDHATVCPECGSAWLLDAASDTSGLTDQAGAATGSSRALLAIAIGLAVLALAGVLVLLRESPPVMVLLPAVGIVVVGIALVFVAKK
jgi:hypothetical protein